MPGVEKFFQNVDYVVNRANELGLVAGLVTAKSWHVNEHPEKVFNEKNACVFGKFLGQRYKNNAIMWFPGGDSPPGKDEAVWVAMLAELEAQLDRAFTESKLPENRDRKPVNELLVRLRLG